MVESTLGNKFTCYMCQCKFYDLNRPQSLCPRCGANQKDQVKPKAATTRSRAAERVRAEPIPVPPEDLEGEAPEADSDGDGLGAVEEAADDEL